MDRKQLKSTVRTLIFDLLREETEEPEKPKEKPKEEPKKRKRGAGRRRTPGTINARYGKGGRFKKFVADAESRAKKEPKALMKDLGISGGAGGDDLGQVLSILNSAIHGNAIMGQSYSGARSVNEKLKDGDTVKAVGVSLAKLDYRNGIKFILHTLNAAKNANYLKLRGALEIGPGNASAIVIYVD